MTAAGSPRGVRLRLTLVYASLFFVFGAVLLGVSYAAVRHELGPRDARFLTQERLPPLGSSSPPGASALDAPEADRIVMRLVNDDRARAIGGVLLWFALALGASTIAAVGLGWVLAGRALRPLQEAFESQRRFVSHASHELRTPLAVMRASIDVTGEAGGYDDPAQVRAMVATQRKALARSEALVDRLLALAMGERGLDRVERVDLRAIVRDVLDETAPAADGRGLRVDVRGAPAPVDGDPVLLRHLVANLVENAVRHNVEGGAVEVALNGGAAGAALTVVNDGPRLDGDVGELLRPFRRAAERAAADGTGYGLGLSVVDAVARAHGATVALQARPEGGLRATVTFPPAR
jgi:signal transduction histidine kinase